MLMKYIRGKNGERRGIVVAEKIDGKVCVGFSLVNSKLEKTVDKNRGIEIATGRLARDYYKPYSRDDIPHSALKEFRVMTERANQYFRDAEPRQVI